jgi:hypothetical protein
MFVATAVCLQQEHFADHGGSTTSERVSTAGNAATDVTRIPQPLWHTTGHFKPWADPVQCSLYLIYDSNWNKVCSDTAELSCYHTCQQPASITQQSFTNTAAHLET